MVRVSTPRTQKVPTVGPSIGSAGASDDSPFDDSNQHSLIQVESGVATIHADKLSRFQFYSYAIGHVLNDMSASCWFTYLLVYLTRAHSIQLHSEQAAGVLLAGQVADAIATPLVGIFSDQSDGCLSFGFGRRKCWYLFGTLVAALCFFMVFGDCLPCDIFDHVSQDWLVVYYCIAASLFNLGWATVQVSHMSMLPELTPDESERVALNSARYAFTVLSNVAVFVIFFILIQTVGNGADVTNKNSNAPWEKLFRLLAIACLGVGGLCGLAFLFGTEERIKNRRDTLLVRSNSAISHNHSSSSSAAGASSTDGDMDWPTDQSLNASPVKSHPNESHSLLTAGNKKSSYTQPASSASDNESTAHFTRWQQWLRVREFYQVGWIYMATRLVVNVSQVLIPFYLLDYLKMAQTSITIIPLVLYIAQFSATFFIKLLNKWTGRRGSLLIGSLLVFAACTAFWFLDTQSTDGIYPTIAALGIGCAVVMVVSQQLQADLVGVNTASGAFVYGAHSFADKLSNGIAIFVVQKINGDEMTYVRQAIVFVPAAAMLLALVFTYLLDLDRLNNNSHAVTGVDSSSHNPAKVTNNSTYQQVSSAPGPH